MIVRVGQKQIVTFLKHLCFKISQNDQFKTNISYVSQIYRSGSNRNTNFCSGVLCIFQNNLFVNLAINF